MYSTNILQDVDFNEDSIFRSHMADVKLYNWDTWATTMLTEKEQKEIARALKKM